MAWPPGGAGTCVNLPEHGWEDRAVSAINTGAYTASLFLNEDCIGGPYPIGSGEWVSPPGFAPKSVPDGNGAGIRQEGSGLTVRR